SSGSGPSAAKLVIQRKKSCPLIASPLRFTPKSTAHILYVACSTVTPGANAPVEKVSTPSELYIEVFSGLDVSRFEKRSSRELVIAVPIRMRVSLEEK